MKLDTARLLMTAGLFASFCFLSPVAAQSPNFSSSEFAVARGERAARPLGCGCMTNLDYLVLASVVDSSNLAAVSAIRH